MVSDQLCTARLERETKYLEEWDKMGRPVRFRSLLIRAHRLKKQLKPAHYFYPHQLALLPGKVAGVFAARAFGPKSQRDDIFTKANYKIP